MKTARLFKIYYKTRGKWSKKGWCWNLINDIIVDDDIHFALIDAKFYLKSTIQVKELINKRWKNINLV